MTKGREKDVYDGDRRWGEQRKSERMLQVRKKERNEV